MRGKHSIVVVELDVPRDEKTAGKACLYVASSSQTPQSFFESLLIRQTDLRLPGRPQKLRQELVLNYKPSRSRAAVNRRLKETRELLDGLGYEVVPHWRVYVLDVNPDFPKPLLDRGEKNHVVYVGQTSNDIEKRLLQHQGVVRGKTGKYLGAPSIEGRNPRVNIELTPEQRVFSESDALRFETEYSVKLRDAGYRVLGDGLTDPAKRRRNQGSTKVVK